MKNEKMLTILVLGLMVCFAQVSQAAPMGTAITYQGRLMDKNRPADGLYDFQFKLYDSNDPCTGIQLGNPIDTNDVEVIDGHFLVELDFGSGIFDGNAVWLETRVVRSPMGSDPATLSPLLELTPTPYSLYAKTAPPGHSLDAADGAPTDSVYVDDNGNVGIGTTTPGRTLDVAGYINAADYYFLNNVALVYSPPGSGAFFYGWDVSVKRHSMSTDGEQRLVIDDSGNVGIGTTNPQSKLSVGGNGFANTGVYGSGTSFGVYGSGPLYGVYGKGNTIGVSGEDSDTGSYGRLGFGDWGGFFMGDGYFSGKVGIGTTGPTHDLEVEGGVFIDHSGVSHGADAEVALTVDGHLGKDILQVRDKGANRKLVVDYAGYVGIGTTSPQAKLHIGGVAGVDGIMYPDNTLQTTAAGGSATVPIGTVIDWWRPDDSFAVPDGYQICDGSVVNDAESPFNGHTLPDLRTKFVRSANTIDQIGVTGGETRHDHTISGSTTSTIVTMGESTSNYIAGPTLTINAELAMKIHKHATNPHSHSSGSLKNDEVLHLPPYVMLLKIMRIR